MQQDIRQEYEQAIDESHHGRPTLVEIVHSGRPGRPAYQIDPDFLRWAYNMRTTASISRFLGVGRSVVRNALLQLGIAEPQTNPFPSHDSDGEPSSDSDTAESSNSSHEASNPSNTDHDDLLDPNLPLPLNIPADIPHATPEPDHVTSFTGPLADLSDEALDNIILRLRSHYRRAGITMIDGMLRRLGYRVQRERIRTSLLRIDPVQRVFARITIRRRVYSVPGPNALWHHDGQHGEWYQLIVLA